MSRSRTHLPIRALTGRSSEKKDKRIWHKRMRAEERGRLAKRNYDEHVTTAVLEVSSVWDMAKDGKMWTDIEDYKKFLRTHYERWYSKTNREDSYVKRELRKLLGK